jgi:hypothetical protein
VAARNDSNTGLEGLALDGKRFHVASAAIHQRSSRRILRSFHAEGRCAQVDIRQSALLRRAARLAPCGTRCEDHKQNGQHAGDHFQARFPASYYLIPHL